MKRYCRSQHESRSSLHLCIGCVKAKSHLAYHMALTRKSWMLSSLKLLTAVSRHAAWYSYPISSLFGTANVYCPSAL